MNQWKNIKHISYSGFLERISENDDKLLGRRTSKTTLANYNKHSYNIIVFPIDIDTQSRNQDLAIFDGKEYFCLFYNHDSDKSPFNSSFLGFSYVDDEDGKRDVIKFVDNYQGWNFEEGSIYCKEKRLDFVHSGQLLLPFKNDLSLKSEDSDSLFDELIELGLNRELSFIFFARNIPYQELVTHKGWSYSKNNEFYYSGKSFNYFELEDMSREYIIKNYSEYINFSDKENAHSVYSTFMNKLISLKLIEEDENAHFLLGIGYTRVDTIKWLGITPDDNNPPVTSLGLEKVVQIKCTRDDVIQINPNYLSVITVRQHNTALQYSESHLDFKYKLFLNNDLKAKVIEVSGDVILIECEGCRLRINAEEVLYNFVEVKDKKNEYIDICKKAISSLEKNIGNERVKYMLDFLELYEESENKKEVRKFLLLAATRDVTTAVPDKIRAKEDVIKAYREEQLELWLETFKNEDEKTLKKLSKIKKLI